MGQERLCHSATNAETVTVTHSTCRHSPATCDHDLSSGSLTSELCDPHVPTHPVESFLSFSSTVLLQSVRPSSFSLHICHLWTTINKKTQHVSGVFLLLQRCDFCRRSCPFVRQTPLFVCCSLLLWTVFVFALALRIMWAGTRANAPLACLHSGMCNSTVRSSITLCANSVNRPVKQQTANFARLSLTS